MREAIRLAVRIGDDPGFKDIFLERVMPTDDELASDDALDDWLRRNSGTSHHISGTCKMGPDCRPDGSRGPVPARERRRGAARCRRVRDARLHPRQHQRHDHHDRRETRRLHEGGQVALRDRLGREQVSVGSTASSGITPWSTLNPTKVSMVLRAASKS